MDRGKQGLKRSVVTGGAGGPLHVVSAGATRNDSPLLRATLAGLDKLDRFPASVLGHLDRGVENEPPPVLLAALGSDGAIARQGVPTPVQAGARWVVERTPGWMHGYGKLRRCTENAKAVVDFCLFLAAALAVGRHLIHRARSRYRWPDRPTTRRLKERLLPVVLGAV